MWTTPPCTAGMWNWRICETCIPCFLSLTFCSNLQSWCSILCKSAMKTTSTYTCPVSLCTVLCFYDYIPNLTFFNTNYHDPPTLFFLYCLNPTQNNRNTSTHLCLKLISSTYSSKIFEQLFKENITEHLLHFSNTINRLNVSMFLLYLSIC